ncbi:MAG TPA: ATP-binding cassette domain-containing protein [Coriobacteriia bacterium]|nr:ATP-binding cassette domain-containing protein [Coriobacteriia bacterium]
MLLSAEGLAFTTPGDEGLIEVLGSVSLRVDAGEIVDVRGPSGAGKTTLLRAVARLLPGATGVLALKGRPAAEYSPAEWRRRVTLAPQVATLMPGTVLDNLLLPWRLRIRAGDQAPATSALEKALGDVGLADVALSRDASRLSVGQAARVALLRVVLTGPDVLLLDEPEANLDGESAAQVAGMTGRFAAAGGAVLRVRHGHEGAPATRSVWLEAGRLTEDEG